MFIIMLAGLAQAVDARVCIEAHTNYTDLNPGADYFPTNIDRRLRGILVEVKEEFGSNNIVFSGRTDVTGIDVGCVNVPVSVTAGETYKFRIHADQVIAGAAVTVHDSSTGSITNEVIETDRQFTMQNLGATLTADPREDWRILAVTGFALNRATGGLFGAIDSEFHIPDENNVLHVPGSCGGPCIDGNKVYLYSHRTRKAYSIAYALGFTFFDAMGGVDFDDTMDDVELNGGGPPLHMASPEHLSAALAAGYAHLYSGIVFNLTAEPDCAITTWQAGDWDVLGPPCFNQIDTHSGTFLSCAVGRSPLGPPYGHRAYYETMSYTLPQSPDVPTVPIDVVRFWWQYMQDHGLSFGDITDIYIETGPASWGTLTDEQLAFALKDAFWTLQMPGSLDFDALSERHMWPPTP